MRDFFNDAFSPSRHEQIKTAISYNQAYADSGCLYFHFGGDPSYLRAMTDVAIGEIGHLVAYPPKPIELERAKTQLQSMLFMNLEQRPVVFEDVARQVLAVGKRQQADYYFQRIRKIVFVHATILRMNVLFFARTCASGRCPSSGSAYLQYTSGFGLSGEKSE